MFELTIALRYLKAKRKQAMISVITVISVIGVAAGVMALVIALAISNGMRGTMERNLLSATAEVRVQEATPSGGIDQWQQVAAKLASLQGMYTFLIDQSRSRRDGMTPHEGHYPTNRHTRLGGEVQARGSPGPRRRGNGKRRRPNRPFRRPRR